MFNTFLYEVGNPVSKDPNRVVVGQDVKSPYYDLHTERGFTETFVGGFKTLRNDPFFQSVVTNKKDFDKIEKDVMNGNFFVSTGDFTGIKHLATFDVLRGCFLVWRVVPSNVNTLHVA